MIIGKKNPVWLFILLLPDITIIAGIAYFLYKHERAGPVVFLYFFIFAVLFLAGRVLTAFLSMRYFNKNRMSVIKDILTDFKKGRFSQRKEHPGGSDELNEIFDDLMIVGKHLDSIVSSQKNEIEKFNELYNNIIFSISSYFLILDENEIIVFANEGFCRKFQYSQLEIIGKKIDELFYFVNARLKGGISQARKLATTVILEKTHLLSLNKISIIADIKISYMSVKGRKQIIIIIDDVTTKLRKDYQLSLMSQISESIQQDAQIDRILYTILTGVTSGSGLGFNRAVLFLEREGYLAGSMAVGPDSFEEAIEIWSSVSSTGNLLEEMENIENRSGKQFLENVLRTKYSLQENNLFVRAYKEKLSVHVPDSWNDPAVEEEIKRFLEVKEFVIVPLVVGNRSIGIIVADNKFNQAPIGNDSIELLSIFSFQAAFSIESYNSLESIKTEMLKIKNRQDAIVESEKMAAVGRIAAHIAHEIRNPLVTMGGYARRILQLAADPVKNPEGVKSASKIILKESERLEKLLSNVMDFTRPSKYILEFNNINEIIKDTFELLRNIFLEKKIEVSLDLYNDLPLVKSDFNQVKQVMLNLLQNAVDATPYEGRIEVSTFPEGNEIVIRVSDTGTGITEDDPAVVFEPFFTTKVTGVGLGLSNVKKIISDHNGAISVENREEGGAEFEVRLPVPV